MKKALIIEDNESFVRLFRRAFNNNSNIVVAECHNVEEALLAIGREKPDVLFIDNDLTRCGNEGLEIADRVKDIKIYSITLNRSAEIISEYEKRGIEMIDKGDFDKIESIVAE